MIRPKTPRISEIFSNFIKRFTFADGWTVVDPIAHGLGKNSSYLSQMTPYRADSSPKVKRWTVEENQSITFSNNKCDQCLLEFTKNAKCKDRISYITCRFKTEAETEAASKGFSTFTVSIEELTGV